MTISTFASAPLVVVVGSTGTQGGSVTRNLIASDKAYRLRGLTRDASKVSAHALKELGVDMVAVNISVGNEPVVRSAFQGAKIVFAVTDFWEHMDTQREVAEGKLMADAAKAVGASLFIFSGLPNAKELSGGGLTQIRHYDGKAEVVAYARGIIPTVDVQAGYYMTNLNIPFISPIKQANNSYLWELFGDFIQPYIDMAYDYGLFVQYAIETPDYNKGGGTIFTFGEHLRDSDAAAILARVRRVKIDTVILSREAFIAKLERFGFPSHFVADYTEGLIDMTSKYGYYFGQEFTDEQKKICAGLARKPRSWEGFLRANHDFFAVESHKEMRSVFD